MKIALYCGERLFSCRSWRRYPLFEVQFNRNVAVGFSIGPILFWDGS